MPDRIGALMDELRLLPDSLAHDLRSPVGRLDHSRSPPGAGLGLALVEAVTHLHGGTLRLADNRPGLRATLLLPISSAG